VEWHYWRLHCSLPSCCWCSKSYLFRQIWSRLSLPKPSCSLDAVTETDIGTGEDVLKEVTTSTSLQEKPPSQSMAEKGKIASWWQERLLRKMRNFQCSSALGYIIYKTTYCRPTELYRNDVTNGHRTRAAFKYREGLPHNDTHPPACLLAGPHTNLPW
jgi:hypothetical protein